MKQNKKQNNITKKHLNQNKMKDFVIYNISLVFMLMIYFTIHFLFENKELTLAITFINKKESKINPIRFYKPLCSSL